MKQRQWPVASFPPVFVQVKIGLYSSKRKGQCIIEAIIGELDTLKPDDLIKKILEASAHCPAFSGAQFPQPEQRTWEEVQDLGVAVEAHVAAPCLCPLQPLIPVSPYAQNYW